MAIEHAILDVGPTISRAQIKTVIGQLTSTIPANNESTPDIAVVDGVLTGTFEEPIRDGQMLFVESSDGLSVTPYIVITVPVVDPLYTDQVKEWRRIQSSGVIQDPRTGQPKDPLYDLY